MDKSTTIKTKHKTQKQQYYDFWWNAQFAYVCILRFRLRKHKLLKYVIESIKIVWVNNFNNF